MISSTSQTEEGGYPREDKCRHCGEHIGWILDPVVGEALALGLCEKKECKEKEKKRRATKR
jgi:hypothetical protein